MGVFLYSIPHLYFKKWICVQCCGSYLRVHEVGRGHETRDERWGMTNVCSQTQTLGLLWFTVSTIIPQLPRCHICLNKAAQNDHAAVLTCKHKGPANKILFTFGQRHRNPLHTLCVFL